MAAGTSGSPPGPPSGPPPRPQRAWRAACPNCGAPVDFASAASASAVCSFCRSTLLREGDALRRIGTSAEVFDDHSPLQLGVAGRHQGLPFTLVGRLQFSSPDGPWNEWHALFDPGAGGGAASDAGPPLPKSAWLSEDNGAYVLAFDQPPLEDAPSLDELQPGERRLVGGRAWSVASVVRAKLLAAEGELPRPPRLEAETLVADLRNEAGEVGTLEGGAPGEPPQWSIGRSVALSELALTGLREASEKNLASRSLPCPSCGAPLEPRLDSTRSITCGQCKAVVELPADAGPGADLAHYAQNQRARGAMAPRIPLGRTGRLALGPEGLLDWQVVGYQVRREIPEDAEDDATPWAEYLLYHHTAGFAFLVDTEEGWSWVRPLTGAPVVRSGRADWQGTPYRERWHYAAEVAWVEGEFYWPVRRDERAQVTDYDAPGGLKLSREQTGSEVTWSAGKAMDASTVAQAFSLKGLGHGGLPGDVSPLSGGAAALAGNSGVAGLSQGVIILIVVVVVMLLMVRCSDDDDGCASVRSTFGESSNEYQQCRRNASSGGFRTGGGSFGGFSSGGGGHK